jgi:predicted transcriptional regulator
MTTTTIRMEDELKLRLASAAKRSGKSAHAFILEAIAQNVEQSEQDDEFHRIADERWATLLATGQTVPWDQAKSYLEALARGETPLKPVPLALTGTLPGTSTVTSPVTSPTQIRQ